MTNCSIQDCDKPARTRGWCQPHYVRWHRHGDPLATSRRIVKGDLGTRLWSRVDKAECWIWTGVTGRKGYGRIGVGRRDEGQIGTHVASWMLAFGPVPEGKCVLHRCDVPACVRPDHLFLGSISDNNQDMCNKRRHWNQRKTHCKRGHEFTAENTASQGRDRPWQRKCRTCERERHRTAKAAARARRA